MLHKVGTEEVRALLPSDVTCFVCCTSFEERALAVARNVDADRLTTALILQIETGANEASKQTTELQALFGQKAQLVPVRIGQPVYTVDQLNAKVLPAIKSATGKVLVDLTTFTHEHLLMLLYFLKSENLLSRVIFAYTGAKDYSCNTALEEIWLSKGVKQVRSVIGYPGALVPSKDLHLIVMVGFEHERAQRVIEAYEPARLSLGFGPRQISVSENLSKTNQAFFSRVQEFVRETRQDILTVREFEFSCVNPLDARDSLLREIESSADANIVICPLNTKISTVGAALAAFNRDEVQLCYAEAAVYNSEHYSSPGPTITLFDLSE